MIIRIGLIEQERDDFSKDFLFFSVTGILREP